MDHDATAGDAELLQRHRNGDEQALERLFDRYEQPLFQFLVGLLHNQHQAEDALQETWCRALQHLDSVDGTHLRGWLFTVAYHQAMLLKRRPGLPTTSAPPALADPAPGPEAQAQTHEAVVRLRELLEQLPPAQREVIWQRIYDGKRFREIAEALDCPLNTALARMHEGLKRLRQLWGSENV